jgi:hypothetical protein
MAKFEAVIGYSGGQTEDPPNSGIWVHSIVEKTYKCETINNPTIQNTSPEKPNGDIRVNHRFSILSNQFAENNIPAMRYITWKGTKWQITSVESHRPRLILTIGGVYNG